MPAGVEELVDMFEVVYTLASLLDVSLGHLEALRIAKKLQRGGFDQKLYLVEMKKGEGKVELDYVRH